MLLVIKNRKILNIRLYFFVLLSVFLSFFYTGNAFAHKVIIFA